METSQAVTPKAAMAKAIGLISCHIFAISSGDRVLLCFQPPMFIPFSAFLVQ